MFSRSMRRFGIQSTAMIVAVALAAASYCPEQGTARAQENAAPKPPGQANADAARSKDIAAVRTSMDSFAKTFELRDAKALATHWTAEGQYRNAEGITIKGRAALEQAFGAFFAGTPEVTAKVQSESLNFLSSDSAVDEGSVTVQRGPTEPATHAHYSATLVREEGKWQLAMLVETAKDESAMEDLSWLIGTWKSASGEGAEILTTYTWEPNKKFIRVQFAIKERDLELSGSQIIGVNPTTGAINTWTFESNGGVGETEWSRDGEHWMLDATGTLANGDTLLETNILHRVNDDTFTWQSIDRWLDDNELADLAPVKVTRIKPKN